MKMPILTLLVALPFAALAQDGETRIAVAPFAALSGDVPQRAGTKAAGMLSNELKNADGFALVTLPRAGGDDPWAEGLEEARAAVKEAEALRARRKFSDAEAALKKGLQAYEKAAPGITEVGELQDAWVLLAAIQYLTGQDEAGDQTLDTALALSPDRELPLAKTSPLFTRVVEDHKKKLAQGAKGELVVESSPSGATVTVDGLPVGKTPVKVTEVPPGRHVWRVHLPSGEVTGGVVEVNAKKQAKVEGRSSGTDPESKMLAALATNRIDKAVVDAARAQATQVQADMLIFGALSRDGKKLVLDSFIVQAASGEVKRLPRSTFDTELLSAGMEFYNLVGRLAKDGLKVGEDTPIPGAVSRDVRGGGTKLAEVVYGKKENPTDLLGAGLPDPKEDEKRTPLNPKKKRKPLRRR